MNTWLVDTATGRFLEGGFFTPVLQDGGELVTLPDDTMPDVTRERYDGTTDSKRRPATDAEIAAMMQTSARDQAAALVATPQMQAAITVFAQTLAALTGKPVDVPSVIDQIITETATNLAAATVVPAALKVDEMA